MKLNCEFGSANCELKRKPALTPILKSEIRNPQSAMLGRELPP